MNYPLNVLLCICILLFQYSGGLNMQRECHTSSASLTPFPSLLKSNFPSLNVQNSSTLNPWRELLLNHPKLTSTVHCMLMIEVLSKTCCGIYTTHVLVCVYSTSEKFGYIFHVWKMYFTVYSAIYVCTQTHTHTHTVYLYIVFIVIGNKMSF